MTTGMCTKKYNTKHPNVKIEKNTPPLYCSQNIQNVSRKKPILLFLIYFRSIMMKLWPVAVWSPQSV